MSAPSMPPDNSLAVEQSRISAQERAQEQARKEAADRKAELSGLRTSAVGNARNSANDYFTGQGLDPSEYSSQIDSKINSILGGIGQEDANPGSYFQNVGSDAFNYAQEGYRSKNQRALDKQFGPDFETNKIPFTLDDPYLSSIEAEQRSSADEIIRNMLDRGIITSSGYGAASKDLDSQAPGVRARLNEVGTTTLAQGQGSLKEIANQGRKTASNLSLGTQFDPYSYGSQADQAFNDFIGSLSDTIKSKLPGDLFSTSGLAAIAGAGQGAQNTKFNPGAAAGIFDDEEDDNNNTNAETIF